MDATATINNLNWQTWAYEKRTGYVCLSWVFLPPGSLRSSWRPSSTSACSSQPSGSLRRMKLRCLSEFIRGCIGKSVAHTWWSWPRSVLTHSELLVSGSNQSIWSADQLVDNCICVQRQEWSWQCHWKTVFHKEMSHGRFASRFVFGTLNFWERMLQRQAVTLAKCLELMPSNRWQWGVFSSSSAMGEQKCWISRGLEDPKNVLQPEWNRSRTWWMKRATVAFTNLPKKLDWLTPQPETYWRRTCSWRSGVANKFLMTWLISKKQQEWLCVCNSCKVVSAKVGWKGSLLWTRASFTPATLSQKSRTWCGPGQERKGNKFQGDQWVAKRLYSSASLISKVLWCASGSGMALSMELCTDRPSENSENPSDWNALTSGTREGHSPSNYMTTTPPPTPVLTPSTLSKWQTFSECHTHPTVRIWVPVTFSFSWG